MGLEREGGGAGVENGERERERERVYESCSCLTHANEAFVLICGIPYDGT